MIGNSSAIFLLPLVEGVQAWFDGGVLDRLGGGAVPDVGDNQGAVGCDGVINGGGASTDSAHTIPLRQLPFTLRIINITMNK